jgi:hypothetical protein
MAATAMHHDHDWSAMSDYRREEAINETRSRQTNEWIEAANDRFGADNPMDEYRCECSDGMCADVVSLTRVEYEAVRSDGLHFFIATHHENPELDQLHHLVVLPAQRAAVLRPLLHSHRNPRHEERVQEILQEANHAALEWMQEQAGFTRTTL